MNDAVKCNYGENCYRLKSSHFERYTHPHLERLLTITNGKLEIPEHYVTKVDPSIVVRQLSIIKTLSRTTTAASSLRTEEERRRRRHQEQSRYREKEGPREVAVVERREKDDVGIREGTRMGDINMEGKMETGIIRKILASEPYRFFLSTVSSHPRSRDEPLSVTFQDLLSNELGDMASSLQINFMVEIGWLLAQYHFVGNRGVPMTLIYGADNVELDNLLRNGKLPHISAQLVKPSTPFGHHHTKLMIHSYSDGSIRVIVHTGNLVELDWENRVQGIWISPKLPIVEGGVVDEKSYDSVTHFKVDLLRYLKSYRLPLLDAWINKVRNANFTHVKVFFIPSFPSGCKPYGGEELWGHNYLHKLLRENVTFTKSEDARSHSLIFQSSSIGSLGYSQNEWFLGEFTKSAAACHGYNNTYGDVQMVYPSVNNVKRAVDSFVTAQCLPYSIKTHTRQPWLVSYLKQWKSDRRNRSLALPHIKTYCRLSADRASLFWFLLTSCNLSKAAWGKTTSTGKLQIWSYEAGVLFLPQILINEDRFPLVTGTSSGGAPFPLPYDIPTTPYEPTDRPWVFDAIE